MPLAVSLALLTAGCGGDDSEPELPEPIETPTPDNPDQPTPDEPKPDEPTPDKPEEPKYHTPEECEFLCSWKVCWEKIDWYRCMNGKWSYYESDIYDAPASYHKWYGWPYHLAFLKDAYGYLCAIWNTSAVVDLDNLVKLVEEKGSINYNDEVILTDGVLRGSHMFHTKWYPEANKDVDMLVFMSGKTVMWRWKITQFDGESFTASPAHYDFPKAEDGSIHCFTTYKFKRFVPETNQ